MNSIRNIAMVATIIIAAASAAPASTTSVKPGWTHDQYLEYLSLNTTEGWEGMSAVTHHLVTQPGEVIDFSDTNLDKRSGDREFQAWSGSSCNGNDLFSARNFGCGVCVTSSVGDFASSGWLWRQAAGNPYPTADWFESPWCSGSREHHQGIVGSLLTSCDSASAYNVPTFGSVMLYQGC